MCVTGNIPPRITTPTASASQIVDRWTAAGRRGVMRGTVQPVTRRASFGTIDAPCPESATAAPPRVPNVHAD